MDKNKNLEVVNESRAMWVWLAGNPGRSKADYLQEIHYENHLLQRCFLCHDCDSDCSMCLLLPEFKNYGSVSKTHQCCNSQPGDDKGPYKLWLTDKSRANAQKMVDLHDKAIERLSGPKEDTWLADLPDGTWVFHIPEGWVKKRTPQGKVASKYPCDIEGISTFTSDGKQYIVDKHPLVFPTDIINGTEPPYECPFKEGQVVWCWDNNANSSGALDVFMEYTPNKMHRFMCQDNSWDNARALTAKEKGE